MSINRLACVFKHQFSMSELIDKVTHNFIIAGVPYLAQPLSFMVLQNCINHNVGSFNTADSSSPNIMRLL